MRLGFEILEYIKYTNRLKTSFIECFQCGIHTPVITEFLIGIIYFLNIQLLSCNVMNYVLIYG